MMNKVLYLLILVSVVGYTSACQETKTEEIHTVKLADVPEGVDEAEFCEEDAFLYEISKTQAVKELKHMGAAVKDMENTKDLFVEIGSVSTNNDDVNPDLKKTVEHLGYLLNQEFKEVTVTILVSNKAQDIVLTNQVYEKLYQRENPNSNYIQLLLNYGATIEVKLDKDKETDILSGIKKV